MNSKKAEIIYWIVMAVCILSVLASIVIPIYIEKDIWLISSVLAVALLIYCGTVGEIWINRLQKKEKEHLKLTRHEQYTRKYRDM